MLNQLITNHHLVEALWSAVNTSSGSLVNVAPLVKKVLKTGAWKKRIVPQLGNEPVELKSFRDFIEKPPLRGCGWPLEKVEALIKDDPETLTIWRRATTAPVGKPGHNSDNITIKPRRGTSKSYTLDRLEREKPNLFEKVRNGEISANAAAIEAGFRKKLTRFEQIERWIPTLSHNEREKLKKLLDQALV